MAYQAVNVGTVADDHTGDPGRSAFQKVNANFVELYAGATTAVVSVTASPYLADPTGVADSTAAIQAACNTGSPIYFPAGTYNVSSMISLITPNQYLFGNALQSKIYATSNFNLAQQGLFNFTAAGNDDGPWFEKLWLSCDQSAVATAGTRANLIQYPAALFLRRTPRFRIINCKIDQFLIGIDMQGASGGASISGLDIGCYLLDVVINGASDSVRISDMHSIPFDGWTTNQHTIYRDGGQIGLATGRMDNLDISNSLFYNGGTSVGINSFLGAGTNFAGTFAGSGFLTGFTTALITNTGFDTNVQLLLSALGNWFELSNCYFSGVPANNFSSIVQNAGSLQIANSYFACGGPGQTNVPVTINNTSGTVSVTQLSNCRFSGPTPAGTGYTLISGTGGVETEITLADTTFLIPNANGASVPLISIVGANPILTLQGTKCTPNNIGGHTQIVLSMDTDNEHNITGNEFNGWEIAVPTVNAYTTWTKAIIANNGKRGVINHNNANIRALAGNAGTATVAAASTVYLGPGGYANAVVSVNTFHMPKAGNIVGFQVKTSIGAGGAQTFIYTVYQNGVATAMTGTLTAGTTVLNVTTNFFAVAAADRIELQLVTSATAAAANHSFSLLFEPS